MNAPPRLTKEKTTSAIHGVLSVTLHRRSKRDPTQYQSITTNNNEGAAIAASGILGQRSLMGQPSSDQARNAGIFVTTANLKGQGQTWNRAVVSHSVCPSPQPGRLSIAERCQSPRLPNSAAIPNCASGRIVRKRSLLAITIHLLDTREAPKLEAVNGTGCRTALLSVERAGLADCARRGLPRACRRRVDGAGRYLARRTGRVPLVRA